MTVQECNRVFGIETQHTIKSPVYLEYIYPSSRRQGANF